MPLIRWTIALAFRYQLWRADRELERVREALAVQGNWLPHEFVAQLRAKWFDLDEEVRRAEVTIDRLEKPRELDWVWLVALVVGAGLALLWRWG